MQTSEVTNTGSLLSSANPYASQELDKQAFMELLVAQLEHQDPLEPMNNENFIAQLASFSSLEELESMNSNIVAMITLNQSNALLSQLTQGSALIGKEVSWLDPVTGVTSQGKVESVKIEQGYAVLNLEGKNVPLVHVTEVLGDAPSDGNDPETE